MALSRSTPLPDRHVQLVESLDDDPRRRLDWIDTTEASKRNVINEVGAKIPLNKQSC